MNRPSRSFDEKVYPAHKIAAVVAALGEGGVSAAEALDGTAEILSIQELVFDAFPAENG